MDNVINELKKNGLLLKKISKTNQTLEICKIAINQNPNALKYACIDYISEEICFNAIKKNVNSFRYVPRIFKTKDLCWNLILNDPSILLDIPTGLDFFLTNDTPKEIFEKIIEFDQSWLEYINVCENSIDIVIEYLKNNSTGYKYLSEDMKNNIHILEYKKNSGKLKIYNKRYDLDSLNFKIDLEVFYNVKLANNIVVDLIESSYKTNVEFKNFKEFYKFLDCNLQDADLRSYNFKNINLKEYNLEGAIIHHNILEKYDLFDSKYFDEIKKSIQLDNNIHIENNEICIQNFSKHLNLVDNENYTKIPIFYVSDIHLCHRIFKQFEKATENEIIWFIKDLVKNMIQSISITPYNSYLLIAGDTSSYFEFAKIFYNELSLNWRPENIIVIHGNHELWNPYIDIEDNLNFYREFFKNLNIKFLHNDLLLIEKYNEHLIISENEILNKSIEELRIISQKSSIAVLGGIGFSALNSKYNAINMKYGKSFEELKSNKEILDKDKYESNKFNTIYKKLLLALPYNKLIILTHMRKDNWNSDSYNPNWIYVNGHDHHNCFTISPEKTIYADNQIGYHCETVALKYFYINNEYNIFTYLEDGIHNITKDQYADFNRGNLIHMSFKRSEGDIYVIKKNNIYIFFIYCLYSKKSKSKSLYLLNGGKLSKLQHNKLENLNYYYESLENYIKNINNLLERYTGNQKIISNFIKRLGGSGKIHGCIIDVDKPLYFGDYSYCHLYVNPQDGKITPYFAEDIKSRIIYKDLKSLLQSEPRCALLETNYNHYEEQLNLNMPTMYYSSKDLVIWDEINSIHDEGSYLYKISRIIKSLQYATEKNVIRIWNEDLLNYNFINPIIKSSKFEDMIADNLIINIE